MTKKGYTLEEIKALIEPIAIKHRVAKVYLFSSYARGTATGTSDIELLIERGEIKGLFALGSLFTGLAKAFDKEIDLATTNSLKYNNGAKFVAALEYERMLKYERNKK